MTNLIAKVNSTQMYSQPKHYAWAYLCCVQ